MHPKNYYTAVHIGIKSVVVIVSSCSEVVHVCYANAA